MCQTLEARFIQTESKSIIFSHAPKLLHVSIRSKCLESILWKLYNDLLTHKDRHICIAMDISSPLVPAIYDVIMWDE